MELLVKIDAEDAASASRQAQALERILLERNVPAEVDRIRSDQSRMDGGSMLAIAFASPVLLELAKALRMFLQRYHSAEISVTDAQGKLSRVPSSRLLSGGP